MLKSYQSGQFRPCEDDMKAGNERDSEVQDVEENSFQFDEAQDDLFEEEEEETLNPPEASSGEPMEFGGDEDDEEQDFYFDSKPVSGLPTRARGRLFVDLSHSQIAACKEVNETLALMKKSHSQSGPLKAKLLESTLNLFVAIFTKQPKGVQKGTEKSCIEPFLALACFNFEKGVFKSCKQMTPVLSRLMYLNQYTILKKVLQSSNPLR